MTNTVTKDQSAPTIRSLRAPPADWSAETARRIACDCSILEFTEDENGEPLSIGRKSRTIPPAIRRALRFRDKGCRFPGCTNTHFIDAHHIQHWADGGETSLENLLEQCRFHHRLLHEGGFSCERQADGKIVFRDPQGRVLEESYDMPPVPDGEDLTDWVNSRTPETDIDSDTCVPETTAGERMDWHLAVGHLFA